MFGLGTLFYFILFSVNSIAILSEDRFLNRIGWTTKSLQSGGAGGVGGTDAYMMGGYSSGLASNDDSINGVKARLINLINAIRTLLRIPLIVINIVVIVYELVLG